MQRKSRYFVVLNYSVIFFPSFSDKNARFYQINVQSQRTTKADIEDHLWSADHSLRNAVLDHGTGRNLLMKIKNIVKIKFVAE